MSAFVTGGAGFIGKRLVRRLLERDEEPVYVLVWPPQMTPEFVAGLKEFWGGGAERVTLIGGDISKPDFGISASEADKLKGRIDHFFHLAAIYDLRAPPEQVMNANIAGVARRDAEIGLGYVASDQGHTLGAAAPELLEAGDELGRQLRRIDQHVDGLLVALEQPPDEALADESRSPC